MEQKWKKYLTLLLACMVLLSADTGVQAARIPAVVASMDADGNAQAKDVSQDMQSDAAGSDTQPGDADANTQAGSADAQLSGENAQPDNTDAQPGETGGNMQSDGTNDPAGAGDAANVQSENADNRNVNAEISDNTPEIKAEITSDDPEDDHVVIVETDKPYLALGANLSNEQRNTVLALMGIDPANLDAYQVVTVTNVEEHQYLDAYLDASIIGTRALSSVVIAKRDKGDGIRISTKNISYCTVGMYKNALATAGLEDADVIIAGPFPLSGTAALIGAMKAYADMENEDVDTESLDAAMNEIVVTGELNESLGDDVQTEEFMAYVKQKVVEGGLQSKEKIQEVITEACKKFEISLDDNEKERITALMEKIGSLDINIDSLLKQAGSIYDSLKEMEKSSGILSSIAAFFKRLIEAIINFFKGLMA